MLIASLVCSAVLLAFANGSAFLTGKFGAALGVAVLGLVGCVIMAGGIFLPGFVLSAVLVAGAAIYGNTANVRPAVFLISSVLLTLVAHRAIGLYHYREVQEYANRTPVVSIEGRLTYEQSQAATVFLANSPPQASSPLVGALEGDAPTHDAYWQQRRRLRMLKDIHGDTVDKFVNTPGFGMGRMRAPELRDIDIPEIESIRQPSAESDLVLIAPESRATLPSTRPENTKPAEGADRKKQYAEFHTNSVVGFVNILGFGYVKDRGQVAGFQEHHFRELPGTEDSKLIDPWHVRRVELVSLLKHAEPCVYLSDNLPRMDELRAAKVRMLDDFEARRLPEILGGEDLVFETSDKSVRLLGAIRAAQACLDCHGVERGALLGAFSYQLGR